MTRPGHHPRGRNWWMTGLVKTLSRINDNVDGRGPGPDDDTGRNIRRLRYDDIRVDIGLSVVDPQEGDSKDTEDVSEGVERVTGTSRAEQIKWTRGRRNTV